MKNLILKLVEKTWLTYGGISLFCTMYWTPIVIGGVMSKHGPGSFGFYTFWPAIIVLLIWAVYFLLAWRIALPEKLRTCVDDHKNKEKGYKYQQILEQLNDYILYAEWLFFSCLVMIVFVCIVRFTWWLSIS